MEISNELYDKLIDIMIGYLQYEEYLYTNSVKDMIRGMNKEQYIVSYENTLRLLVIFSMIDELPGVEVFTIFDDFYLNRVKDITRYIVKYTDTLPNEGD